MYASLLTAFVLVSCGKEITFPSDEAARIVGTWQWIESTGGIAGVTRTPASTGESIRAIFTSKGTYQKYVNNQVEIDATYSMEEGPTIYSTELGNIMHYTGEAFAHSVVISTMDTLLIRDECYDCFIHTFVRDSGTSN